MTDRDDLRERLNAVEEELGDTSTPEMGSSVVYRSGDGYVTPDGDPVPTDDAGSPIVDGFGSAIILDGEYSADAPAAADGAGGDTDA